MTKVFSSAKIYKNKKAATHEFKVVSTNEVTYNGLPGIFIEGWASVSRPKDRYGDTIVSAEEAFKASIETYFELNPILLYEHGFDPIIGNKPLGQVISYRFDDYGLWIKAFVRKPNWAPLLEIYNSIKAGILKTFSIGGIWSRQGDEIVSADLIETSVVATPAQPYCVFDLATKSFVKKKQSKKTSVDLKIVCLQIMSANVDYWTEHGQRLLKNKMLNAKMKRLFLKRIATQLEQSIHNLNVVIRQLEK